MKPRTAAIMLICFTAIAIAAVMFVRRASRRPEAVMIDRNVYSVTGIDISAHNGHVDFDSVASDGVDFVYIKASEGANWRDKEFEHNYRAAIKAGLLVGVYHYFRFDVEGWRQSVNLLRAINHRPLDMPVAIDVEEWGNSNNYSTDEIVRNLQSMIELLRQGGYQAIIYTNKSGYHRFVRGRLDDVPLWICSFTSPAMVENERWTFWQYSHCGHVAGVRGKVDLNTYNSVARGSFDGYLSTYPSISTAPLR